MENMIWKWIFILLTFAALIIALEEVNFNDQEYLSGK